MSLHIWFEKTVTTVECSESYNITHNLTTMAKQVGLYYPLWRPEGMGIETGRDLLPYLEEGLHSLIAEPAKYKEFEPANGWGTYEWFVEFLEKLIDEICLDPDRKIGISR